jgi:sn-glycerol 3-phosphate transport system permease protein
MIFVTLMLPVEVRICPTYKVVSDLGMLNTYAGPDHAADRLGHRHLPVPPVLPHRARRTGRGRAHRRRRADALLQGRAAAAVATSIAALFVIQFIYGWNQYLWPLLMTTDESMYPVVMGIKRMIVGGDAATEWNLVMATAMLAMLPPALVVMLMQKWFVKGLVDTEK